MDENINYLFFTCNTGDGLEYVQSMNMNKECTT